MNRQNILAPADIAGLINRFASRRYNGLPREDVTGLRDQIVLRLRGLGCFALAGTAYSEVGCVLRYNESTLFVRLSGHDLSDAASWIGATLTIDNGVSKMEQIQLGGAEGAQDVNLYRLARTQRYYERLQDQYENGCPPSVFLTDEDRITGIHRRVVFTQVLRVLEQGDVDTRAPQRWIDQANRNTDRPEPVSPVALTAPEA